jgi:hypothetical protein
MRSRAPLPATVLAAVVAVLPAAGSAQQSTSARYLVSGCIDGPARYGVGVGFVLSRIACFDGDAALTLGAVGGAALALGAVARRLRTAS